MDFEIMLVFFAFALRSKKWCWDCSLSSENTATANLPGNGDLPSCFPFDNTKGRKQLDVIVIQMTFKCS